VHLGIAIFNDVTHFQRVCYHGINLRAITLW